MGTGPARVASVDIQLRLPSGVPESRRAPARSGPSTQARSHTAYEAGRVTTTAFPIDTLYRPPRGRVEFVDVPAMDFLVVPGKGAPEGPEFMAAIEATAIEIATGRMRTPVPSAE